MTRPHRSRDELVARIAAGLPVLERYVRVRMGEELRSHESVSDVVQSTARDLLRSGGFEDRGEASFQAWLRKAAEHKLRKRARYWRSSGRGLARDRLVTGVDLVDLRRSAAPTPGDDAALSEERERVLAAVGELPEDYALVVRRLQLEGASYADVADELGRSPEAVRKLLARALARLAAILSRG